MTTTLRNERELVEAPLKQKIQEACVELSDYCHNPRLGMIDKNHMSMNMYYTTKLY